MKNLNVDVAEQNGNIVFLHKIVEGSASRSYGIHVAKLAGIPKSLLERAQQKLYELESGGPSSDTTYGSMTALPASKAAEAHEEQISMFSFASNPVVEKLKALNLMDITPSKAFEILEELKELL